MSKKSPTRAHRSGAGPLPTVPSPDVVRSRRHAVEAPSHTWAGRARWLALGASAVLVAVIALAVALGSGASPGSPPGAADGTVVQATGGSWVNITPDRLASMLEHKDFTLLNVKTPYIGEIGGTDLYIPYNQLASRRSELPSDKTVKIVVYCRSGAESAVAAQTLVGLGYTNVYNLDGGMNAWTQSGRDLVNLNRS